MFKGHFLKDIQKAWRTTAQNSFKNYKSDSLETKHREMRGESKPLSNTKVPLNIQLGSLCFYIAYILLSDLMQGKL